MGGKGIKRREKNYRAAHGGSSRLPPPPVPSSLDAVPSKLRKIMSLTGAGKQSLDGVRSVRGNGGSGGDKKPRPGDGGDSKTIGVKRERNDQDLIKQELGDSVLQSSTHEKKKRRKSKKANDLRFETEDQMEVAGSKRKERKKQRLEARKKKNKKAKEVNVDFPGHEKIKFGDIVVAPPKLVAFPKGLKTVQDASQERLRLQAVDAYRNRKGWTSRPGGQLPLSMNVPPSL
ncbi:unnamed protein product [Fraxinus pennsylvanica]|uniref:Uncharacterized protein n=1 Tax=Fraxinus pennsylvanica TaxID=56036 RepID=A0AAD2AAN9_9LAMI|nr:unnamed protein product [Fraxinus pennsylvanica]